MVRETDAAVAGRVTRVHPVVAVGLLMVLAQGTFRAWAAYGAWFYGDDFEYLLVARHESFDVTYLALPHGGHLLPMTRVVAGLLVRAGDDLNWTFAATSVVILQLLASLSALWALVVVFGRRWGTLAPLAIYLTSAITVPAMIWWAAALNQLGHQAGLFLAVGAWVQFERTQKRMWLVPVFAGIALSFFCDARGLFIPPLLAMISVGWFATGPLHRRIAMVLRRHWLSAATMVLGCASYWLAYSRQAQEDLLIGLDLDLATRLFGSMIGEAFASGIVGGPWRWDLSVPPTAYADPPTLAAALAWVVITLVVLHACLTRTRALRAFAMAATYLAALFVMVLVSRAPIVGEIIGREYRYLTDAAPVVALALGFAYLGVDRALEASAPRTQPLFTPRISPVAVVALVTVVALSGLWSSVSYISKFHDSNAAPGYVAQLREEIQVLRPVDLADLGVPPLVVTPLTWPQKALPKLTELMGADVSFPDATDRLGVVTDEGRIAATVIADPVTSPAGPAEGCGWKIDDGSLRIPLTGELFRWNWWMRIGYLSGADTPVTVRAGDTVVRTTLRKGLHSLYVKNLGGFDSVLISGLDPDVTVCVDVIEVGNPVPGAPLK